LNNAVTREHIHQAVAIMLLQREVSAPSTLPTPHPMQQTIKDHHAKRVVINAGRRSGKTTLAAIVAVEKAREGRRVLLSSTTQEQADSFWDKCKDWLAADISRGRITKNETRRILGFPGGGRIKVKTAWDADSLRGDHADFLVLDECALLAPDAWDKVGAPMLLDNDGDAWFISTPRRRNWFFHLYQRAVADGERWAAWHFTSFDNPHLSEAGLAEIAGDLTDEAYRQEIMAEFLEGEGSVFRNIAAACTAQPDEPGNHQGHTLLGGLDWGQKNDYTAISIVCATCKREVALDRFNKVDWAFQRGRVASLAKAWRLRSLLAEENSIGGPNIEALRDDDRLPMQAFTMTSSSKPPLIRALALALERVDVRWLNVPAATAEMEAYEARVNPVTGHTSYSAPDGMHDDTVIARALAYSAAFGGRIIRSA
jgi:hypothetical protein